MKKLLKIGFQKQKWEARVTRVKIVCENVVTKKEFAKRAESAKTLSDLNTRYESACIRYQKTHSIDDKYERDRLGKTIEDAYATLITELNLDIDGNIELAQATGAELIESVGHRKGNLPIGQGLLSQVYNLPSDGKIYVKANKIENAMRYIYRLVAKNIAVRNPLQPDIISSRPETMLNGLLSGEIFDVYVCGMDNTGRMGNWSKPMSLLVV
jgi:hypothetical protein